MLNRAIQGLKNWLLQRWGPAVCFDSNETLSKPYSQRVAHLCAVIEGNSGVGSAGLSMLNIWKLRTERQVVKYARKTEETKTNESHQDVSR